MRLSFDDKGSFQEAIESLRFNNSSDPNTRQQIGSSNSMPLEDSERNADRRDGISPSDPIPLRRVKSSSSLSIQEIRRSADIPVTSFNNLPSNPEFIGTLANEK